MSFSYSQDITIISLIVSLVSLVVVLIVTKFVARIRHYQRRDEAIDVMALVQEFREREKRLEQKMIDEKVKLEILELRLSRRGEEEDKFVSVEKGNETIFAREQNEHREHERNKILVDMQSVDHAKVAGQRLRGFELITPKPTKKSVVKAILEMVAEGRGNITARQIQEKVGRSREHTARIMNFLYKQGLVSRDVNVRPFTYSLTEVGRKELGG